MVEKTPPIKKVIRLWSEDCSEAMKNCFECTDWQELCVLHGENTDALTHCITDYINFRVENTVPTMKVRCFSNNKPLVTPEHKGLLNEKKRALRFGNREELRTVRKDLKYKIWSGQDRFWRKMEV